MTRPCTRWASFRWTGLLDFVASCPVNPVEAPRRFHHQPRPTFGNMTCFFVVRTQHGACLTLRARSGRNCPSSPKTKIILSRQSCYFRSRPAKVTANVSGTALALIDKSTAVYLRNMEWNLYGDLSSPTSRIGVDKGREHNGTECASQSGRPEY